MSGPNASASRSLRLERRVDGCALLVIDVPGEAVNTLSRELLRELEQLFEEIEADASIRAVVLMSGKAEGFVAGADLKLLRGLTSPQQATELSRSGQLALSRIERSTKPFVAAVAGACLGGGLELALACRARVGTSDDKTRLGLPEVQLGLLPGLGGTQRLPRLVGVQSALDLMLTGKQLDARRALRLGLLDEVVARPILVSAAVARALSLQGSASAHPRRSTQQQLTELALAKNPIGRKLLFREARKQLRKKTLGNYPAPERILEVVEIGLARGMEKGLWAEAAAFGELLVTAEARELIGLFFASNELKKDTGVDDASVRAVPVHKVGVLGAGLMGAGIAYVTLTAAKLPVRLKDRDDAGLGKGLAHVRQILDERVQRRRLPAFERDRLMSELTVSKDYLGFADAEVVIEAVFEDLALKQQVLADIEEHGTEQVIFASNTSSLPISAIASNAKAPERVVGMHYFSPVHKMPLLEVVVTPITAPWVTATAVELGKRQGKTVIVVRDGVGFYTSRILGPYLNEASFLLAEGVPIEVIDEALVGWGFPVGPLTLLDEVGIDVGAKVGSILHDAFGERMRPASGVERLLDDQRLGRKNKRGFYLYGEKKSSNKQVDTSIYSVLDVEPSADPPPGDIAQRCALMLVNEAVRCFEDRVLRSARDGDIGAVFGLGFPPFRGGPFRYADVVGARELVRRLRAFAAEHGSRFEPAELLVQMAERGKTFHGPEGVTTGVPGA
ncbi:MAG TPA: fatty acid oxidation complex subunit alpha FadJ [Polyangiaceae bacterium]|nr:fatty acid oxidation complex subunit alpha FadJ [Polyangiaceae bacterium]